MLRRMTRCVPLVAVTLIAWVAPAPGRPVEAGQEPTTVQDQAAKIHALQLERLAATRAAVKQEAARVRAGQASPDELFLTTRWWAEAELDVCTSDKDRVTALGAILATARETERLAESLAKTGQGREGTALRAKAERLRFEVALERAKGGAPAGRKDGAADPASAGVELALREKQVAVKKAAVRVADARQAEARASLDSAKAQVGGTKAAETAAERQLLRFDELSKAGAIDQRLLDEQRARLDAAKAGRVAAETGVAAAESRLEVEMARRAQAQLEVEEAQLRAELLKAPRRSP